MPCKLGGHPAAALPKHELRILRHGCRPNPVLFAPRRCTCAHAPSVCACVHAARQWQMLVRNRVTCRQAPCSHHAACAPCAHGPKSWQHVCPPAHISSHLTPPPPSCNLGLCFTPPRGLAEALGENRTLHQGPRGEAAAEEAARLAGAGQALTAPFVCVRGRVMFGPQELQELADEFERRLGLGNRSSASSSQDRGSASSSQGPGGGGGGGGGGGNGDGDDQGGIGGERWLLSGEVARALAARLGPASSFSPSCDLSVEEIALHENMAAGGMGEDPSHHFWRPHAPRTRALLATGHGAQGQVCARGAGREEGEVGGGRWWGRRGARVEEAWVKSLRNLTDTRGWPDVRDVRHLVLQVPHELEYNAGDVALVYPRNRPAVTNALLHLLGLDGDARINGLGCPDLPDVVSDTLNIQAPCTVRELISAHPDLQRAPRTSTLRALALLAGDADERERLLEIADNPAEFRDYIEACRRPIIGALPRMPACPYSFLPAPCVIKPGHPCPVSGMWVKDKGTNGRGATRLCLAPHGRPRRAPERLTQITASRLFRRVVGPSPPGRDSFVRRPRPSSIPRAGRCECSAFARGTLHARSWSSWSSCALAPRRCFAACRLLWWFAGDKAWSRMWQHGGQHAASAPLSLPPCRPGRWCR